MENDKQTEEQGMTDGNPSLYIREPRDSSFEKRISVLQYSFKTSMELVG